MADLLLKSAGRNVDSKRIRYSSTRIQVFQKFVYTCTSSSLCFTNNPPLKFSKQAYTFITFPRRSSCKKLSSDLIIGGVLQEMVKMGSNQGNYIDRRHRPDVDHEKQTKI